MAGDDSFVTTPSPGLTPSSSSIPPHDALISIYVAAQAPFKLSASNYPLWHFQWLSLLIGYNLMAYVDGSKICPIDFTSPLSPDQFYTLHQYQLLRSSLLASLTPAIASFVSSAKTSYETWIKLAHMYAKPSRGSIAAAIRACDASSRSVPLYVWMMSYLYSMGVTCWTVRHDARRYSLPPTSILPTNPSSSSVLSPLDAHSHELPSATLPPPVVPSPSSTTLVANPSGQCPLTMCLLTISWSAIAPHHVPSLT
ncbi:hypothetical protein FEM48_Zijuj05G0062500 [Ziziphus jujuba var. spinosa]|uniref:Uncharacterized protein n=1 Tax=Ziziphus jujuba var. spinosa TaxID=714518 RepID=A0A978VDA3_ZIZJJ|nr:hypothetical protein FEM48_Zijuj05G0062500 [Ziziphus jujuba var. spinosa]